MTVADGAELSAGAWDAEVATAGNPNLLQSYRWGELQADFGWTPERRHVDTPAGQVPVSILVAPTLAPGGRFGYVPKGPPATAAAMPDTVAGLGALATELGLAFLRIEPELEAGFTPPGGWVTAPATQPAHTSIVDIRAEPEALLAGFKPKTRYNIRLAQKKGVEVARSDDIAAFANLAATTSARHHIQLATEPYYRRLHELMAGDESSLLYLARHEGDVLAGIMVVRFAGRATYLFGASSETKRNLMPAYLLHWHAIQELRGLGDTDYDLWGVPPDDQPGHPLSGLWQFKSGWNGRLVAYAGAFDLPIDVTKWRLHKGMSQARGSLRRMKARLRSSDG